MNIFLMILTCLNIILVLGLSFSVFLKVKEKKEDQRITKGLQLLQHKIAILEDLSDKADEQVQRLVHMLDTKSNELRRATNEATVAMNSMSLAKSSVQNSIQNSTQNSMMSSSVSSSPSMSSGASAAGAAASINMDELNQFVQAINQQNEKIKPASTLQNNIPQDFISTPQEEIKPAVAAGTNSSMSSSTNSESTSLNSKSTSTKSVAGNVIRPFEFRRVQR